MMSTTTRFGVMGFVCGLMLSVSASCGLPQGRCTATSCPGCCDSRGMCQTGTTPTACGQRGMMCTACGLGQTCGFGGVCSGGSTGTGGDGVGGSGVGGSGVGGSGVGGGVGGSGVGGGVAGSGVGGGVAGSGVGGGVGGSGAGGGAPPCNTCLANTGGQLVCVPSGTNLNLTTCGRNGGLCQNCVQQGAAACVMGTCQGSMTGGGFPGVGGGSAGSGVGGGAAGGCVQISMVPQQNFVAAGFSSNPDAGFERLVVISSLGANQDAGTGFFGVNERYWNFGGPRPFFPESFTLPFNNLYQTCDHCLSIRFCLLDLSQCASEGYFARSGAGQWTSGTFNTAAGTFSGNIGPTNYVAWNFMTDSPSTMSTECVDIGSQSFSVSWP